MSPEMVAIFGVGAGLAVLIFGLFGWMRADMARVRQEFRSEMALLRQDMREEMVQLRQDMREEMVQLRHDMREDMTQLRQEWRQELRDAEQRIIRAIVSHRHPEPDSEPVFGQPV